ncbi:uncharacterized protein LOC131250773 isoform X2 [Magnolia sinica]|uniref:uncharacterized protein LOC131250773 isoform X2 n=1 Tax=Magnolia sinica TaxID=86752 RepID=UPI002659A273|nr:uncharacterized protein LOC131250773 isoform X2 [Magnolia sinica]
MIHTVYMMGLKADGGCLDVLLTFGAYSTAIGMVISRLFIRLFWFGLSSVFATYIYMKVLEEKITGTQILSIFKFIFLDWEFMLAYAYFLLCYLNSQLVTPCQRCLISGHSFNFLSGFIRFICLFIGVGVILCHFLFWLYYSSDQEWVLPNMLSYIGDLIGLSGAGMCSFHILRP